MTKTGPDLGLRCRAPLCFCRGARRRARRGCAKRLQKPSPRRQSPKPAEGEGPRPKGEAAKPEDGAPSAGAESAAAPPPEGESEPLTLAELTRDGFEIRTTNFIPAEAVTRQSGKVSSDAFVVTLQKATSTAICFYTLKAYVGKKLTTIPACTVHR